VGTAALDPGRFDVISFDCYGTLVDWESGIVGALRPILASHDLFPGDDELLASYAEAESSIQKGPYLRYREVLRLAMQQVTERLGIKPAPEELDYLAGSLAKWPVFPDTVEALKALKTRFKLAIISNTDDDLFSATARSLEVPFDWVVTAERARAYKPSEKIFGLALETMGVPKERLLHAAQSLYHDVAPAKKLGIATVWVDRRGGAPGGATPPSQARADAEVPDLRSLAAITSRT
jgi:2-haloacid dehalogenase